MVQARVYQKSLPWSHIVINMILVVCVIVSAFALVYLKDRYRRDFIAYQHLLKNTQQLHVDYGKLLLEDSTWASATRVQHLAQKKLNMYIPSADQIQVIVLKNNH